MDEDTFENVSTQEGEGRGWEEVEEAARSLCPSRIGFLLRWRIREHPWSPPLAIALFFHGYGRIGG